MASALIDRESAAAEDRRHCRRPESPQRQGDEPLFRAVMQFALDRLVRCRRPRRSVPVTPYVLELTTTFCSRRWCCTVSRTAATTAASAWLLDERGILDDGQLAIRRRGPGGRRLDLNRLDGLDRMARGADRLYGLPVCSMAARAARDHRAPAQAASTPVGSGASAIRPSRRRPPTARVERTMPRKIAIGTAIRTTSSDGAQRDEDIVRERLDDAEHDERHGQRRSGRPRWTMPRPPAGPASRAAGTRRATPGADPRIQTNDEQRETAREIGNSDGGWTRTPGPELEPEELQGTRTASGRPSRWRRSRRSR